MADKPEKKPATEKTEKKTRTRKEKVYSSYKDLWFKEDSWKVRDHSGKQKAVNALLKKKELPEISGSELEEAVAFFNTKYGATTVTAKVESVEELLGRLDINQLLDIQEKLPAFIKAKSGEALETIRKQREALDAREKLLKASAK